MSDKPFGCLFPVAAALIAIFYVLSMIEQQKHLQAFSKSIEQTMKTLTGSYYAVEGSIEEINDETPYYFPPGLPKETEKEWNLE